MLYFSNLYSDRNVLGSREVKLFQHKVSIQVK